MTKYFQLLCLLLALTSQTMAEAQEKVFETRTYVVENMTTGTAGTEDWRVEGAVDVEEDPVYTTKRVYSQPPRRPTATLQTERFDRRLIEQDGARYMLTWGAHPTTLDPGERTYGYLAKKSKGAWVPDKMYPVFYEVWSSGLLLMRLTTKMFVEGGITVVTEELFTKTSYHFPIEIKQRKVDVFGATIEEIVYRRQGW